ncbi:RNA polymerase sigma factor [Acidicapsa ligni]|uniref:RNA polymerase sigma factor n=1 Tax=Acidicapsa ligni TaxID=542300 RepID=UPI0021DF671D|nr:RNA polymerase sigma factor [Acidicapsa ligni]
MNMNPISAGHEPVPLSIGAPTSHTTQTDTDSILVDRVLSGELQAFAALVERWQRPLINMAWRYCHDRHRAEDMAQEALLRVWRGLAQWRRESSFSTWLFSVAANIYRTELKHIPSPAISFDQVSESSQPSIPFVHDAELDGAARDEAVRRAVFALPEKYREPLILFYFHEMDLVAAAATMRIPTGTMKARLSRGRALLKQRFPQLREQLPEHATDPEKSLPQRSSESNQNSRKEDPR